jgi:outer membrane protein OmpA-like peptidoglycan-associated protein
MRMGKSRSSRCGNERRPRRLARRLVVLGLLLGLGACNPVETVRDWTGASQNDPDPDTTPNTRNLAAGEASDYPNLATVPPPPIRAMTAAERDKLTQSLIADRTNARYTNEQLRAGFPAVSAASPPPTSSLPPAREPGDAAAAPGVPPSSPIAAAATSLAAPLSSVVSGQGPSQGGARGEQATALPSTTAANAKRASGKTLAAPGEGLRKQGEPPESGPLESSLEMPQARATPQPEQIQPAPPPPQLPPTPRVASTLPSGLAPGGVLARTLPPPVASGSAGFQPPPPPPEMPALPPSRSAAAGSAKSGPKPPAPVGTPVAEIKFGADSTSLSDKDRQTLETVVPLYQENPGKVRIVGYAGAGGGAVEQLNSYRSALDRAQAVAAALTQAGIPSDKIQVEAAPASANSGESRAEILLEH